MTTLIKQVSIVNEDKIFVGDVKIENDIIAQIGSDLSEEGCSRVIDGTGKHLFPGLIDDQVHFREPGPTHKAEIYTESRAAVAGGVTSFMEMPNTVPNTLTQELLEDKYKRASEASLANYSFFMGASNDNLEEVLKTNPQNVCGVKVFMGSSTGNMLVDNTETLDRLFKECKMLIATHCEDEATIRANSAKAKETFGEDVPIEQHPIIRDVEACYLSSSKAIALARKHNTRLHILHISTAKECGQFDVGHVKSKRITSEACIHHLWFSDENYAEKGTFIKWNPAVKSAADRDAILAAVLNDQIDVIATDHAPHTIEEKQNTYFNAPSGGPLIQHSLVALLEMHKQGKISLEMIVKKACHAVADCFDVEKRGYIREGYFADLALVDLNASWTVNKSNILAKCGWSPFEGDTFSSTVTHTWVSGNLAYENGELIEGKNGQRLTFER